MSRREYKTVAVNEIGVFRIKVHELVEEYIGAGGHAHGHTWMATLGLLDGVDSEETN